MDFFLLDLVFNFHTTLNGKHIVNFIIFFTVFDKVIENVFFCILRVNKAVMSDKNFKNIFSFFTHLRRKYTTMKSNCNFFILIKRKNEGKKAFFPLFFNL